MLDEYGRSNFSAVASNSREVRLVAFDLLSIEGRVVTGRPIEERKELLAQFVPPNEPGLTMLAPIEGYDFATLWEWAQRVGHEGLVLKRKYSNYVAGRSRNWLKIKTAQGRTDQQARSELFARR